MWYPSGSAAEACGHQVLRSRRVLGTPARVSTYAYVNPAVAVLLGWLLANERLDARAALAVLIILSAVALVSVKGGDARRPSVLTQEAN